MISKFLTTAIITLSVASAANAKNIRYSEMDQGEIKLFLGGHSEDVCEFSKGDIISVKLEINGDIVKSTNPPETKVEVQKGFFLKMTNNVPLLSWDGVEFRPFRELISGEMSVGATGDQAVDSVLIKLDAKVRN